MKITYYSHSPDNYKTKELKMGTHVIGVRLLSLEITSNKELEELLTEEGIKWAKRNLRFSLRKEREEYPVEQKESNWGSDWVDDGA